MTTNGTELLESLPSGRVLQTVFSEVSGSTVFLLEGVSGRRLFVSGAVENRYRGIQLGALGEAVIDSIVAPHGVDFLVCLAVGKQRMSAHPPVSTAKSCWVIRLDRAECSEVSPSEHPSHWIMQLLGPGQAVGTALCVACTVEEGTHHGKPAIVPRYGVALLVPESGQISILNPDIGSRF